MAIDILPNIVKSLLPFFPKEASLAIADEQERVIFYQPSKTINLNLTQGSILSEGTVTHQTFIKQQETSKLVDKKIFGVPYYGIGTPIKEGEKIIGCFTVILPPYYRQLNEKYRITDHLIGRLEDRWVPISLENIHYVSSNQGKTFLHTSSSIYENKFNLSELEQLLPFTKFIRCHRSFIVQINSIAEIQPHFHSTFVLLLKDGMKSRIPVSQSYASIFRQTLGF